jgi:hypothetical protein
MQEKTLRQILCFVCIEAPTPHKQVDRLPIDPADLRKGILGTRRLALRRQEDRAPTGGAKSSSGVCWRWRLWLQSDLFRFPKLSDTPDFKNRFYTLQPASSQIPTQHFQERLKLRAGITVLVTRTHLTSLVRQLWVAFWGEQQAVVGTRRDGLYFCPQDPEPFCYTAFASLSQNQEGCCIEIGRSPWHADGSETSSRAIIRSRQLLAMVRLRSLAGRASISPHGLVWIALPKLQLCSTNMAAVWAGNSHCSIVLSLRTSSNQPSWTST